MRDANWDNFVRGASMRYGGMSQTPEDIMETYHRMNKRLATVRERLKNPVSLKGGGPLQPASIRQIEREEKELIQSADEYRKLIEKLVKYNLLPTSKLISGADRKQFIFSLQTMIELPEFGKAVYYANRLMGSRYDPVIPSTNNDYVQWLNQPGSRFRSEQEERSRESMCDALVNALNETLARIMRERKRLLFSGTPGKPHYPEAETKNQSGSLQQKPIVAPKTDTADAWKPALMAIKGGSYEPPVNKVDDHLGDEFRAFLIKARTTNDQIIIATEVKA